MAGSVRALFESFTSEKDLQVVVADRRDEGLYLEFKEKQDPTHGKLDDDDRKNFSKSVSGFANADGGVLIFGIATKKTIDGADRADALKPISNVEGFLARLKESVLNTTQAVVDDIDFRLIPSSAAPNAGYVSCIVPASDKTPHRAMLAGREYFRRTTTGFRRLEHIDLEDMFGRRPRPKLTAVLELRLRPGDDPHEELHVGFLNEGRAIARYSGAIGELLDPAAAIAGAQGEISNATHLNQGKPFFQFIDNVSVIHPNGIIRAAGHVILRRPAKGSLLKLRLRWYCDRMTWREEILEVQSGEQRAWR